MKKDKRKVIPIFFASDNNYAPYLAVSLKSLLSNASSDFLYKIHILTSNICDEYKEKINALKTDNSTIEFISLENELKAIKDKFHLRDYYSIETYYRFFIADLFPQYNKVIYLDCDIAVLGDISDLYCTNITNYMVGAVQEQVMSHYDVFGRYVEEVLDVKRKKYFNAGVLLINTELFRAQHVQEKFFNMMARFKFRVTQDEDYLNVICKNKVKYLDLGWNKMPFEETGFDDVDLQLIHYNLGWKPWHYENILYEEYFWDYAFKSGFYNQIKDSLNNFTEEMKKKDHDSFLNLQQLALNDINDHDNYKKTLERERKHHTLARSLYTINNTYGLKTLSRLITVNTYRYTYLFWKYWDKIKHMASNLVKSF